MAKTKPTPKPPKKPRARKAKPPADLGGIPPHEDRAPAPIERPTIPPTATQVEVPGTEQEVDDVLEARWLDRSAAIEAGRRAREERAEAEAAIELRFAELRSNNPEDPRAQKYKLRDGNAIRPDSKFRLGVDRAKAMHDQARDSLEQYAPPGEPTDPTDVTEAGDD